MPGRPKRGQFHGASRIAHEFVFSSDHSFYTVLSHFFQKPCVVGRGREGHSTLTLTATAQATAIANNGKTNDKTYYTRPHL
jgi:hypothetical protein